MVDAASDGVIRRIGSACKPIGVRANKAYCVSDIIYGEVRGKYHG